MARPILASPTLNEEDSEALLRSLERHCSDEEFDRRVAAAKRRIAEMMRPKPPKVAE